MISLRSLLVVLVVWTIVNAALLTSSSNKAATGRHPDDRSIGGKAPTLQDPEQAQVKSALTSSPSPLDASPLRELQDDLLYMVYLLHPWPNVLAAVSGRFRDSLNEFRTHNYVFRIPRPAIGIDQFDHMEHLVKEKTKSLGKYRLTVEQIRSLLIAAIRGFYGRHTYVPPYEYDTVYLVHVVNDLLGQPNFVQTLKSLDSYDGIYGLKNPVCGFLMFQQADLACKVIRAAGLSIDTNEVLAALHSGSQDSLTKLCELAEEPQQQVTFKKTFVEAEFGRMLVDDYVSGFRSMNQEDFRKIMERYLKVAKSV